jgi:hypothetical protein
MQHRTITKLSVVDLVAALVIIMIMVMLVSVYTIREESVEISSLWIIQDDKSGNSWSKSFLASSTISCRPQIGEKGPNPVEKDTS